jgi:hypothetical protein
LLTLAHTIKNKVEAAYNRSNLFEKRAELMATWADYVRGRGGQVIPFRAGERS